MNENLWAAFKDWFRTNTRQAVVSILLSGILGALFQVICMAYLNEGTSTDPATVRRDSLAAALFCSVFGALTGYALTVGPRRALKDLRDFPKHVGCLVQRGGRVHILWGAASSLVASYLLAPLLGRWTGGFLGLGLALAVPSLPGRLACNLLQRGFSTLIAKVAPTRQVRLAAPASMAAGLLGSGAALLAGIVLGPNLRLMAALGCGVLAYRWGGGSTRALVWFTLLAWGGLGDGLWADDGGWSEANGSGSWPTPANLINWLHSPGAQKLIGDAGVAGSLPGLLGGSVGSGLGGVAAGGPYGWPPDLSPGETLDQLGREITDPDLYSRWKKLHEDARTGKIDEDALRRLAEDQERQRQQRLAQIDGEQQRNSEEFRARKSSEERAREKAEKARRAAEEARKEELLRQSRNLINKAEPERRPALDDFLDRHRSDPEDLEKAVKAISQETLGAEQQRNLGESEAAQEEAKAYGQSEEFAKDVRDWSKRINRNIARGLPDGSPLKKAANLVNDIQDATYAGIEGYAKDGLGGAFRHAAASGLDNFTQGMSTPILEADNDVGKGLGNWAQKKVDSFNPFKYAERIRNAKGVGDLVDIANDAQDARKQVEKLQKGWQGEEPAAEEPAPTQIPRVRLGGEDPPAEPEVHGDRPTRAEEAYDGKRRQAQADQDHWRNKRDAQRRAEAERNEAAEEAEKTGEAKDYRRFKEAQKDLEKARQEAAEAQDNFEKSRQEWAEQDIRGQDRKLGRELSEAAEEMREKRKQIQSAQTPEQRAQAQQELQQAMERRDQLFRQKLQSEKQVQQLDASDAQKGAAIDQDIQDTFKPSQKPRNPLKIAPDTRALAGQLNADTPEENIQVGRETARHVHRDGSVDEVQIAGKRKDDLSRDLREGKLPNRVDLSKPITTLKDGNRTYQVNTDDLREHMAKTAESSSPETVKPVTLEKMSGYHLGTSEGKSASLPNTGSSIHERIHAHVSNNWLAENGRNTNLNEGMTEHFARKLINKPDSPHTGDLDRSGHYDKQAGFVQHLEKTLGGSALEDAYFRGDMEQVYEKLGGNQGPAAGQLRWQKAQDLVAQGKYELAKQVISGP